MPPPGPTSDATTPSYGSKNLNYYPIICLKSALVEPVYAKCSHFACNLPRSPAPVPKYLSNYLCSQPVQCGTQPSIICPPYWALREQSVWCGALPTEKIQLVVTSLKEFLMSVQLWPHSVCELASMWWYPTHPPEPVYSQGQTFSLFELAQ